MVGEGLPRGLKYTVRNWLEQDSVILHRNSKIMFFIARGLVVMYKYRPSLTHRQNFKKKRNSIPTFAETLFLLTDYLCFLVIKNAATADTSGTVSMTPRDPEIPCSSSIPMA